MIHPSALDRATSAQRRMLFALFRDFGISDRDQRLRVTSTLLDRRITSTTDLTRRDASTLIDILTFNRDNLF